MTPFTANQNSLTIHVRVTKKCNADCSYCSSYENHSNDLMSLVDLEKSMIFIKKKILELNLGGTREMIAIQYIGGEMLSVPEDYLKHFSDTIKDNLSPLFKNFIHGAQSNLIGSTRKINKLFDTFDGNVGTSFDSFTEQRTVKSNPKIYKSIFLKNVNHVKKYFGKNISGIIVIDEKMAPFVEEEIEIANKNKRHLVLRPVFDGGSPVQKLTIPELETIYEKLFDNWILKQNIIIEPFYSYLQKRINNLKKEDTSQYSGCPSQHNCANVSMDFEPDGSLYICQDMADSKTLKLGNALTNEFDYELFNKIKDRSNHLNSDCLSCDYFKECQGGCMKEAIEQTADNDMYGKTLYCSIWKSIFRKIDLTIENNDIKTIEIWLNKISKY
ncbi:SPASM domain-containing protein [archaeon]|nr:SPASM domain-containing protein [archaeon]